MGGERGVSSRLFLQVMVVGIAIVTLIAVAWGMGIWAVARDAREAATRSQLAIRLHEQAGIATERNHKEIERIRALQVTRTLNAEKICSDSLPGNCQALFDRLIANVTARQRVRAVCDMLSVVSGYQAKEFRRNARCPKPTRPAEPVR